jgi:pimeloyl-ACP methyl ester carboxylesterase
MSHAMRHYVEITPGIELHVEEAGAGRPIVFVPGWTGTVESYAHQIDHFGARFRAIAFDPRCQGRSTKTAIGVTYRQQGEDLALLLESLDLKGLVLVSWSYGCLAAWECLRRHGLGRIAALVFVDQPPRVLPRPPDLWDEGDLESQLHLRRRYAEDPRGSLVAMFERMSEEPRSPDRIERLADLSARTPPFAGSLLLADALTRDETGIAEAIDGKVPVLHVVSEEAEKPARAWLARHSPSARLEALGTHLMVVQRADRFNALVDAFLAEHGL